MVRPRLPPAVIAWSVWAASIVLAVIGLLLLALSFSVDVPPGWGFRGFPAIFTVVWGSVGLLIALHHPRNAIAWWLLVAALLAGIQVLAMEYAFYALLQRPGELPGGEFGAWVLCGATSAAFASTFFLGILTLTQVLRPITQGDEVAVAASTLASFALFQPIRRRVQNAVDRRFDRSRYDASRTLDTFADQLRDEVDLDTLRADLIGAVRGAIAPAHASLWLREGPR
jgi:hypothetical protein